MSDLQHDAHLFAGFGICVNCGRTREAAGDAACTGKPAPRTFEVSRTIPRILILRRPLAVIPSGEPDDPELGALLVAADDSTRVAAAIHAPAATFDADAAFRSLDDVRSHAETVRRWVEESLAGGGVADESAGALKPGKVSAETATLSWLGFVAALAVAAIFVPAGVLVPGMKGLAYVWGALSIADGVRRGFRWVVVGVIAAPVMILAAHYGSAEFVSSVPWLARLAVFVVGLLCSALVTQWFTHKVLTEEFAAPVEYVLDPGEAERYQAELCIVGEDAALSVALLCLDGDGRLLRYVVAPVERASRDTAHAVVHTARSWDDELARIRKEEEVREEAAAEALRRVEELERGLRQLPGE